MSRDELAAFIERNEVEITRSKAKWRRERRCFAKPELRRVIDGCSGFESSAPPPHLEDDGGNRWMERDKEGQEPVAPRTCRRSEAK
jgi:hypothetical protein